MVLVSNRLHLPLSEGIPFVKNLFCEKYVRSNNTKKYATKGLVHSTVMEP